MEYVLDNIKEINKVVNMSKYAIDKIIKNKNKIILYKRFWSELAKKPNEKTIYFDNYKLN